MVSSPRSDTSRPCRWRPFLIAAALEACRGGCAPGTPESRELPVHVLREMHFPPEETPGYVDVGEGDVFLVAGVRGPVQVWSEADAAGPVATLPMPESLVAAQFASSSEVFVALERGTASLWSWAERRTTFSHDFGASARWAALGSGGRYVAFGGAVFDRVTGHDVGTAKPLATQSALEFSADGGRIVSAGFQEPWIVVRDLPSGDVREWAAPGKVALAALGTRGDRVAAALRGGDIHVWQQPGGEELGQFDGGDELRALRFGPDDSTLVMADSKGVFITDLSGKRHWRRDVDGTLWVFALDGDWAAAGTVDGRIWLWALSTAGWEAKLRLSSASIAALDVDAQRRRLAAVDETGAIAIWQWQPPETPR